MKHFSDEQNDSMADYEFSTARHNDDFQDYRNSKPIGVHYEQYADDWYEGTIKHFQDE